MKRFRILTLLLLGSILGAAPGCSIEDSRDECCGELVLHFRYTRGGDDMFARRITCISHWLFDSEGRLIQQIDPAADQMQVLPLTLPDGDYAILSVANMAATERMHSQVGVTDAAEIMLELERLEEETEKDNCSRIYYGYRTFRADGTRSLHYHSDMSNAHCVLDVTVRWKGNAPVHAAPYTLRLDNIAGRYSSMLPEQQVVVNERPAPASRAGYGYTEDDPMECTEGRVVHSFPRSCSQVITRHKQDAPMYNNQVRTEFVTLRYRDDQIPTVSMSNGASQVLRPIDLTDTFRRNGWVLDRNIEQKFAIIIEIGDDGTVTVYPAEVHSNDWEDGGTIG